MVTKRRLKGTYCLLMDLKHDSRITVGKLGELDFKKGGYVYVGSALNSLEGRIERHLRNEKKLHWHVDYLLAHENSKIMDVVYAVNDDKIECKIAHEIAEKGEGINDFGCSDCKCHSHLFYFKKLEDLEKYCLESYEKLGLSPQRYL